MSEFVWLAGNHCSLRDGVCVCVYRVCAKGMAVVIPLLWQCPIMCVQTALSYTWSYTTCVRTAVL